MTDLRKGAERYDDEGPEGLETEPILEVPSLLWLILAWIVGAAGLAIWLVASHG